MLIHPWDAALDEAEWRGWLAEGRDFGQLISVGGEWPVVVPTHFALDGDVVLVHLARPNPVWAAIESTGRAVLSVVDDYAFIPSYWRTADGDEAPPAAVPTSYYAAVQLRCRAEVVDDPEAKAELLRAQLRHFQPEGRGAEPAVGGAHTRLLPGIRGLRLHVVDALAKFKYDDQKPAELRESVRDGLRERATGRDAGALEQLRRRMTAGD